jgi:hypothetical protein
MNDVTHSPVCERATDLISFLYGEASEAESRDFQVHLQGCQSCQTEMTSFGAIRQAVGAWKDEALGGFVSTQVAPVKTKSAVAALKEFFDLSPLWLKGAVGFASLLFCLLAVLAVIRYSANPKPEVVRNPGAIYTEEELQARLRKAQEELAAAKPSPKTEEVVVRQETPQPRQHRSVNRSTQFANGRRPLTRSERDQLAADLRLVADEEGLDLLVDRINNK